MAAFVIAAFVSIVLGQWFINFMKKKMFGQVVRDDGPESHFKKRGTPTMGGVFVVAAIALTLAVCGNFNSSPLVASPVATIWETVIGKNSFLASNKLAKVAPF